MAVRTIPFQYQSFSPKQQKVLTWWLPPSPYADWDMIIADGSIRSGKTISFIDSFFSWAQATFSGQAFILASKSMNALKRNILRPLFQMMTAKGVGYEYNRSENYVIIGDNTFFCFGANNEASQDVLQGMTAAGALLDDVALFPENFVEQVQGRCSVDGAKIWMNCNPESPHHHIKKELIDKAREKQILHFHFTMDDNYTLSEKRKAFYRRMFTGLWYKRFVLGLWVAAEGAIYDMFDEDIHVVDTLPQMKRYWASTDYGTLNPTIHTLYGEGVDQCMYAVDEWYWDSLEQGGRQMTDAQYSRAFIEWLASHGVRTEWDFVDPSASSYIAQLYSDGVSNVAYADNSVLDGIRRMGTMIAAGRFKFHRRCNRLIREITGYVWDSKAQERGEDKPLKIADHGPDNARYFINGTRDVWGPWIHYRETA